MHTQSWRLGGGDRLLPTSTLEQTRVRAVARGLGVWPGPGVPRVGGHSLSSTRSQRQGQPGYLGPLFKARRPKPKTIQAWDILILPSSHVLSSHQEPEKVGTKTER